MEFSDRIKLLRTSLNLTSKQLGDALEVDATSISKWEQAGIIPNAKMLLRISNYFCVSTDYLLGLSEGRKVFHETIRVMQIRVCQNEKPFTEKTAFYEDMTPDDINKGLENDFFISTVLDDAMLPLIYPTDMLLISRKEKADSGDLVFLTLDDKSEGIVRKIIYKDGAIELHSVNPYYPAKLIDNAGGVKIYGIVKKLVRRFKEDRYNGKFQHEKI